MLSLLSALRRPIGSFLQFVDERLAQGENVDRSAGEHCPENPVEDCSGCVERERILRGGRGLCDSMSRRGSSGRFGPAKGYLKAKTL